MRKTKWKKAEEGKWTFFSSMQPHVLGFASPTTFADCEYGRDGAFLLLLLLLLLLLFVLDLGAASREAGESSNDTGGVARSTTLVLCFRCCSKRLLRRDAAPTSFLFH